ncbi:Do family serine endopeptidase, partial [Bacteroidales bacterium OttesenSCG-928-I21]|nr:Do family serine endopeptidase [Bacteroidales bacterium OttesenSCG-928-I21]
MSTKKITKKIGNLLLIVLISGGVTYFTVNQINKDKKESVFSSEQMYAAPTTFTKTSSGAAIETDFTVAAEKTVNAVVHVKTKYTPKISGNSSIDPIFEYFFGRPDSYSRTPQPQMGSGSGVIISADGYIVTNNHVIEKSDEIEVMLNDKRSFTAELIGKDPSTDLALLKINATDLSPISFGDSDDLKVGEWVLAVGNPFNLTSTVTAGIVSAKARNINILSADMKIESFIQTDAAVNPGNSGGALVNTSGELVGINTAIASQTGNYAGYAFAIPTSIVSKVVADLKEFGTVQRALLGVSITDINNELAKEKNIKTMSGAYVAAVMEKSAAADAGIKEGDVITTINKRNVKNVAELQEQVSRYRPGDKINVTVLRDNKERSFTVELKNQQGNTGIVKKVDLSVLGAEFQEISNNTKQQLRLNAGMQVKFVDSKGKFAAAGIKKDFIVVKLNNTTI